MLRLKVITVKNNEIFRCNPNCGQKKVPHFSKMKIRDEIRDKKAPSSTIWRVREPYSEK